MPPVVPKIDLVFAISAVSSTADDVFKKTKETITSIIDNYGTNNIHYAMISFGNDAISVFQFGNYTTSQQLKDLVANVRRSSGGPVLDEALRLAREVFNSAGARRDAHKVLVVITDKKPTSSLDDVIPEAHMLDDMDVKVIPVGIGGEIFRKELDEITPNISDVITISAVDNPEQLGEEIMVKVLKGRNRPLEQIKVSLLVTFLVC